MQKKKHLHEKQEIKIFYCLLFILIHDFWLWMGLGLQYISYSHSFIIHPLPNPISLPL